MERLITTNQNNKLIQMLNDQQVSIENIEVVEPEIVSPKTHDSLFRPFAESPKHGIKKITEDFNDWADFYLNKPNGLF